MVGLVRALETRFPVVERLVGEEFFRAMAQVFVTEDPPRSPILFRYGSTFPGFIEKFAPAADVPFLADVARLELARGRAYHAADALPLPAEEFAMLDANKLASTGVRLHPSTELLTSSFPIVSIWRAHQRTASRRSRDGKPRPRWSFAPNSRSRSTCCRPAASIPDRAVAGRKPRPRGFGRGCRGTAFDPVGNLTMLIETGVVAKLVPRSMPHLSDEMPLHLNCLSTTASDPSRAR